MKTTNTPNNSSLQNVITATALIIVMVLGKGTLMSQNAPRSPYLLGLSIGSQISGNAHGTIFEAGPGFYNGKNLFSFGACMQKRSMQLCGASFNYMHILTGKEDFSGQEHPYAVEPSKLQLFFYSRAQYLNSAMLSYNDVKKEETIMKNRDEVPSDASRIRLSTIDVSAGIGLNVKLCKQLVWSNYIGFGTYYHLNYKPGMYCEKMAPVIVLGTSLRLNYFTR
jgi:hypothetical protein